MCVAGRRWGRRQRVLLWGVLLAAWEAAWGQLRYSVPEEMPKGSFVGDVAKDLGLQLLALQDHGVRVVTEGTTQHFALHGKTGYLVTAERIDREQLCRLVEKCIVRCELIVEGKMKVYGIQVEITDINDNAPSFREADKELRLSETTAPGSRFPLAEAHDPDLGRNSLQSYELSGDEHFSLAVQAGPGGDQRPELVLAKALDREEAAVHELVLRASDGGDPARTGTARIRVTVLDANDNTPVFSQTVYAVRVPEDVPVGSVLVIVMATDADDGPNGNVKYSFHKISDRASELFHLDSETGEITVKNDLDFEEIPSHELEVQARDGGELSDTAKVVITVTDVNDNEPKISMRSALSEISEDAPSGTVVALLHLQDRDSGSNGEVRCSLNGTVPFRLEKSFEHYYHVVTARELDREQVSEYNLTIRAADGGSPSLQSSAVLALRVLDVNDNAPVDLPMVQLKAVNSEQGGREADFEPGNQLSADKQYFTLSHTDGNLYVKERLDREELCGESVSCSVSFEALVHNPINVFHVDVAIQDVNDNSPTFSKATLELEIGEWILPGARFPLEMARDADAGSNSLLTYQLSRNPSFSLALKENTGGKKQPELLLDESLDREKQSSFELVLMAVDGGDPARSGTVQVRVNVTDANDNPPVFSKNVYEARVAENQPAGSLILQVQATDADVGSNGRVSYFFSNVPDVVSSVFAVDAESGEVRTAGPLDFEEKSKYVFGLEARDGGGLTGHCEVQIDITDENDNVPEIITLLLSSPVPEDAPVGTVVALLKRRWYLYCIAITKRFSRAVEIAEPRQYSDNPTGRDQLKDQTIDRLEISRGRTFALEGIRNRQSVPAVKQH
ncbi:hypothetical protein WISP_79830 [Willisornis vidua]|uniref:Cadherin domain-containing protein n=1 Tax=Willisornis vidua TaxID=1566151 RepID=A0ABQ9DAT8_9PASS|nr:hypothetical protein WISP_79830 [Willisornis vidua]